MKENNQTNRNTAITLDQIYEERNTNPAENTQQNPLPMKKCSYSEVFTETAQNPFLELPQNISRALYLEQKQAKNESVKLQYKKEQKLQIKC